MASHRAFELIGTLLMLHFCLPSEAARMLASRLSAAPPPCTFACFYETGRLLVSGIHIAETHLKTLVVIDRTDVVNSELKFPNNQNAYAEEVEVSDLPRNKVNKTNQRPLDVKSNVFCSTGQFLPDGTLLSIGGASDATNADPLLDGASSIRSFKPCSDRKCDFQIAGKMTSKRWYPTAQIMADGTVLIVGGADIFGNIAINSQQKNNPTVEYYPQKDPANPINYELTFLKRTIPFNLYPFVHLLPSGLVFIFAGKSYVLFDPATNQEVPGNYPDINAVDSTPGMASNRRAPIVRSYPVSGGSAMFPLTSTNGYKAEIMVCGGSTTRAQVGTDKARTGAGVNADDKCWRIQPEVENPQWTQETMCPPSNIGCSVGVRRVMGDAVLLADGNMLLVNGAGKGFQGLKQNYASAPALTPLIYNTANRRWNTEVLGSSKIPRMYHSSALLMHDATVLITGSNPNAALTRRGGFPTEFRTEIFTPPYLWRGLARPAIIEAPPRVYVRLPFAVAFVATQTPDPNIPLTTRFTATLIDPGFSTHNQRHGMRNVNLDLQSVNADSTNATRFLAMVWGPPSLNHAPPGLYWLHILDNGIPNVSAVAVNVTAGVPFVTRDTQKPITRK